MASLLVILALLVGGGGVSYAAEQSLPGDALYAVKVSVNEEARSALSFSPKAKAEWELRRLERRLEEAEKLASKKELKPEVLIRLQENFERHAARVAERAAELEERDLKAAADLSSNFETSVKVHARVLDAVTEQSPEARSLLKNILDSMRVKSKDAEEIRIKVEDKIKENKTEAASAAQGKLGAAENKIKEVGEFIARKKEKLGVEAVKHAEEHLVEAQKMLNVGKVKLEAGAYGEAFALFQDAHREAQEAKLTVEANENLNIVLEDEDDEEEGEENEETEEDDEVKDKAGRQDIEKKSEIKGVSPNTDRHND